MSSRLLKTMKNTIDYNASMKASFARIAKVKNIIALKTESNDIAKVVNLEQRLVVELQWNIQN